jgi:beta-N-acetylhexosaminidase
MKHVFLAIITLFVFSFSFAQKTDKGAKKWVDKTFKKLSRDEKIAQLLVIRAHSNLGPEHVAQVTDLIKKYNVGGLVFFQGGPIRQANLTNYKDW